MIFQPSQYSRLKHRLQNRYLKIYKELIRNLKMLPSSLTKEWLLKHHEDLAEYSHIRWYFIKQVETFVWFSHQIPELSSKADQFHNLDDDVFEAWNKSEFSGVFLKALNEGKSVKKASEIALKTYDKHLVTLGDRHILKLNKMNNAYRVQTSLGEVIRAGKVTRLLETTLHIDGKELNLATHSMKEMKAFSQRIETALKVIKKFSPDSWERFKSFTDVIIPIKQPEFVSYSHQELPCYSMINLYHRDFVDLMDDLLHENGHHHMNHYLNLGKLIDEPVDCIYYSPWRRTLRPFRGIYHAYFTFFWAFKLFSALAEAKEKDSIFYLFSEKEKEKIYWRATEEFWMLSYSYQDLVWAKKQGLITEAGWKIIQEQNKELKKFKKKVSQWEKKLKAHRSELKDLKKVLSTAAKKYKKI